MRFRGLGQLTLTEIKLNLREPAMLFWALAFPPLWIGLFGALFKEPMPGYEYEGLNYANFLLSGGIGLIIIASAFIGMSTTLTTYRETGVLKRLRVTPLRTLTLALSFILSQSIFITLGIVVLFIVNKIFFNVQVLGSWLALIGMIVFGILTFLVLGCAIGSISRSPRAANLIAMLIYMPMLFLSDMFLPISMFPSGLQPICRALPLTPLNTVLRDIVYGLPMSEPWQLGIMAGWLVFGIIITIKFFRWE
jgi:ABC-2 type transport system permease protein